MRCTATKGTIIQVVKCRGKRHQATGSATISARVMSSRRLVAASALARRFFPEPEVVWLLSLEPEDQRRALLESWVCKEAAVKWQGSSLARDLRHWSWDATQRRLLHLQRGLQPPVVCGERNGWLWAAVGDGVAHGIWS